MTEPKDIDEVILAIQAERPVLTKDRRGQVGNQKTKYADLVQVNEVVLKLLNSLSTTWTCRPHLEAGAFGLHYSLKHVPSGTELAGVWPLKLSENPQQMGSATTYGRRYALLAVTGIVADDEDDDGNAAAGERYAQRAPARAAASGRPAAQATAQRAQRPGARPPLPTDAGSAEGITVPQQRKLHATLNELGLGSREDGLREISKILGRPVESTKELSKDDAITVINGLDDRLAGVVPRDDDWPETEQPPDAES